MCNVKNPLNCTKCFPPMVLNLQTNTCVDIICKIDNCLQCQDNESC